MPVILQDRPIEQLRQEVIDQLIMNYGHEKISLEAFERRLDEAMDASDHNVLLRLTEDLELTADKKFVDQKKQEMFTEHRPGDEDRLSERQEVDRLMNIFSSSDRRGVWHVARDIKAISIFGGSNIDLSEAIIQHGVVHIKLFSVFGGTNILVPEAINVRVSAFCLFGAVHNRAPSLGDARVPTIVVEGFAIFSGVNIKLKRSLRERFMRFTDGVKAVLS